MINPLIEVAWAAGFFDGEGCIRFRTSKSRANRSRDYGTIHISIAQVHSEPLDRFKNAVDNIGRIGGPYGPYKIEKQAFYQYTASGINAVRVFNLIRPYVSSIKLQQGEQAIEAYRIQVARPRLGNGLARRLELRNQRGAAA